MFRRRFLMAALVAGIATLAGPATRQGRFPASNHRRDKLCRDHRRWSWRSRFCQRWFDYLHTGQACSVEPSALILLVEPRTALLRRYRLRSTATEYLTVTNNSGGNQTLTIMLTDNGFTAPLSPGTFVSSSFGGTYLSARPVMLCRSTGLPVLPFTEANWQPRV